MKAAVADFQFPITGRLPRRSGRQLCDALDKKPKTVFVRKGRRQWCCYSGDHFGDAGSDLDQRQADGIELGIAPRRGLGC